MPNLVEDSPIDLNNISSHFFLDSEGYKQLKKEEKPYRYLYNLTTPRSKRKALEKKVDVEQQNQVAKSWEAFIELYYNNKLQNFSLRPKKNLVMKK